MPDQLFIQWAGLLVWRSWWLPREGREDNAWWSRPPWGPSKYAVRKRTTSNILFICGTFIRSLVSRHATNLGHCSRRCLVTATWDYYMDSRQGLYQAQKHNDPCVVCCPIVTLMIISLVGIPFLCMMGKPATERWDAGLRNWQDSFNQELRRFGMFAKTQVFGPHLTCYLSSQRTLSLTCSPNHNSILVPLRCTLWQERQTPPYREMGCNRPHARRE